MEWTVIGTAILKLLKVVFNWIWGFTKKWVNEVWLNKWTVLMASVCLGIFLYFMGMLSGWFGFPPFLNTLIHGVFHLSNMAWVVSLWKSVPAFEGREGGGSTTATTGN